MKMTRRSSRFPRLRGLASQLLACACLIILSPLAEAEEIPALTGNWMGDLACGRTEHAFHLSFEDSQGPLLIGIMTLRIDESSDASYRVQARMDRSGNEFRLIPREWIERDDPSLSPVGLSGSVHDNRLRLEGQISGCTQIVNRFIAERVTEGAEPTSIEAQVAPVSPTARSGGDLDGVWEGALVCENGPPEKWEHRVKLSIVEDGDHRYSVTEFLYHDGGRVRYEHVLIHGISVTQGEGLRFSRRNLLQNRVPTGIQEMDAERAGSGLTLSFRGVGPATWRCTAAQVHRTGAMELPWTGEALIGTWRGDHNVLQTALRLDVDRVNGQLVAQLQAATPPGVAAIRQEHWQVRLVPIRAESGHITLVPTIATRAEGVFSGRGTGVRGLHRYVSEPTLVMVEEHPGPDGLGIYFASISDYQGRLVGSSRVVANTSHLNRLQTKELALLDGGDHLPVPLEGIGGKLGGASHLQDQCQILRHWAEPYNSAPRPEKDMLLLVADSHFVPVFGAPHGLLTVPERNAILQLLGGSGEGVRGGTRGKCLEMLNMKDFEPRTFESLFGREFRVAIIVARQANRNENEAWFARSMAELDDLAASMDVMSEVSRIEFLGQERIASRSSSGTYEMRLLPVSLNTQKQFESHLSRTRQRLAPEVSRILVERAIARSEGLVGVRELLKWEQENTEILDQLAPAIRSDRIDTIVQAVDGELEKLMAREIEVLRRPGGDPLMHGIRWYRNIENQYEGLAQRPPVVAALRQFRKERDGLLEARQGEIISEVRQSDSMEELNRTLGAVALLEDQHTSAGRAINAAAGQRRRELEAEAEIARVRMEAEQRRRILGDAQDAGDVPPDPASREPTAGEMYDAVEIIIDDYNAYMARLDQDCEARNFQNDPLRAMECLSATVASGGRGGVRVHMNSFRKISCAQAQGRPGWICEYQAGLNISNVQLPASLSGLLASGSDIGQKRFVWDGAQWLARDAVESVRLLY